jgi:hypothetical protein
MTASPHEVLEAGRTHVGMSFEELWISYFALGGTAQPGQVRAYLTGRAAEGMDYDVLAQAINERFLDRGGNHPVPYRSELAPGGGG